jgi:threonine/homoserine/homoserine lactone efflux protein
VRARRSPVIDPAVLPAFLAAVVFICVAPGPDQAYIVAVATRSGPRAGLFSALGMALGMAVYVVVVSVGLAAAFAAQWLFCLVESVGAVYLVCLGIMAVRELRGAVDEVEQAVPPAQVLRRAAITNLTNPKVLLFFAALLPQFVRPGHGAQSLQLLVLGVMFLVVGLVIDACIGYAAGLAGRRLDPNRGWGRVLRAAAAGVYLVLGTSLAIEAVRTMAS